MGLQPVHALADQLAHVHFHACRQIDKNTFASIDDIGTVRALPFHTLALEANEEVFREKKE